MGWSLTAKLLYLTLNGTPIPMMITSTYSTTDQIEPIKGYLASYACSSHSPPLWYCMNRLHNTKWHSFVISCVSADDVEDLPQVPAPGCCVSCLLPFSLRKVPSQPHWDFTRTRVRVVPFSQHFSRLYPYPYPSTRYLAVPSDWYGWKPTVISTKFRDSMGRQLGRIELLLDSVSEELWILDWSASSRTGDGISGGNWRTTNIYFYCCQLPLYPTKGFWGR